MEKEIIIRDNGTRRIIQKTVGESKTRQEFKKQSDINNIMAKYQKTGVVTHIAKNLPQYGDAMDVNSLTDAIEIVEQANESFMQLPSSIRTKFKNDPQELINFLQNSDNKDEAIKLGLIDAPEPAAPNPNPEPEKPEPKSE